MEGSAVTKFDEADLAARIRAILTAPDTDLKKISAKRVRKELERTGAADAVRDHRERVTALIGDVFLAVSTAAQDKGAEGEDADEPASGYAVEKRERGEGSEAAYDGGYEEENPGSPEEEEEEEEEEERPRKKKKKTGAMTDEELARQLSKELNGARPRATRGGSTAASGKARSNTNGKKGSRKGGIKSVAHIDSDASDSEDETPRKKRKSGGGGGGARGGFGKEYALSEPLSVLVAADKLSRPQVVKQIWAYIKDRGLQNPEDKREIMCDDKLRAVFNVDKINMFKMNKDLGRHLLE